MSVESIEEVVTRRCYACQEVKEITEFHRHSGMPLGRRYDCKECAIQAARVRWYSIDPVERSRKDAEYYRANIEKRRAYHRRYKRENKEIVNAQKARRQERIKANGVYVLSPKDQRWLNTAPCYYCNEKITGRRHIDHVIPVCRGGTTGIGNLVPMCENCSVGTNGKHTRLNSYWFYRYNRRPHFIKESE